MNVLSPYSGLKSKLDYMALHGIATTVKSSNPVSKIVLNCIKFIGLNNCDKVDGM
jgi:hypothetical protein